MRTWLTAAGAIAVCGSVLFLTVFRDAGPDHEVTWATVVSAPITMTIETSGTVEPLTTVQVGCEVTGKIIELLVDDDDAVTRGQVICRIDPELAQAENEQSKADHLKAVSALADAKLARDEQIANLPVLTKQALARKQEAEAALVSAEYNWKRIDALMNSQNASEAEWVLRKSEWLRAQSTLTAAEAAYELAVNNEKVLIKRADEAVAQAEAALRLAEARLDFTTKRVERCTIRSPIDGIVLKRFFDVGTTVTAGFQTPLLFLLAPSLDQMRINAKVSESDISHIEIGQPARFTLEARQPLHFEGHIEQKHSQPETVQNVTTYTVSFTVENDARHTLLPGLSVNVVVECVSKPQVPQISNAALRFKPPLPNEERHERIAAAQWPPRPVTDAAGNPVTYCSKAHAWQYREDENEWVPVPLWIGVTDNLNTEILSGAKAGDRFVKKFVDKSGSGFSLKEAMKLASPDNRTL